MSVMFYFLRDTLYINLDGEPYEVEEYSRALWNTCMEEIMMLPLTKQTQDSAIQSYADRMSELKQLAIPCGELGIKIIREITKIATAHLMFVMRKQKEMSKSKSKSGFIEVSL